MGMIRAGSWVETLIDVYSSLGGEANWEDVYEEAKRIRTAKGLTWPPSYEETIRDCVQRYSSDSQSDKRKENTPDVFYAVVGKNSGRWGLRVNYDKRAEQSDPDGNNRQYFQGLEGIMKESRYLRRSRNPSLVQQRKITDRFACQACGYTKELPNGQFVIDVHHINPLGALDQPTITTEDDLVCLCPNCHRIAHSRREGPLGVQEIRDILGITSK
jgi:5-methylcytosine-specific restriction endonuclease McrA